METWVKIEEFSTLANLTREKILEMVANGELKGKQENGEFMIDAGSGTKAVVHTTGNEVMVENHGGGVDSECVEKNFVTIHSLHEQVMNAKEETILRVK